MDLSIYILWCCGDNDTVVQYIQMLIFEFFLLPSTSSSKEPLGASALNWSE